MKSEPNIVHDLYFKFTICLSMASCSFVLMVSLHLFCFSPDAFDTDLLLSCMSKLKQGQAVAIPNYDFKSHKNYTLPARQVFSHIYQNGLSLSWFMGDSFDEWYLQFGVCYSFDRWLYKFTFCLYLFSLNFKLTAHKILEN